MASLMVKIRPSCLECAERYAFVRPGPGRPPLVRCAREGLTLHPVYRNRECFKRKRI